MTANTPNYSIPYPESTDPPNGAAQMQALATAADTALVGLDARLDTLESVPAWVTSGFAAATGWSVIYLRGAKRNGVIYIEGYLNRTGATITATSDNVADTLVCTIPSGYRPPTNDVPVYMQASVCGAGGRIETNGNVTLMVAGANIATAHTVQFQAVYPAT